MLAIIQEIGVIQSVIIAACIGFLLGMLVVIVGDRIHKQRNSDYVDWAKVPKDYDWAACDSDESPFHTKVWMFSEEPRIHGKGWELVTCEGTLRKAEMCVIGNTPLWTESLRRRPS